MEPIAVSSGCVGEFYFRSDVFTRSNAVGQHLSSALNRHAEFGHSGYDNAPASSKPAHLRSSIGVLAHNFLQLFLMDYSERSPRSS